MDFPDVWQFKQKEEALNLQTFLSNETAAQKIAMKLPLVKMVSILIPEVDTTELERIFHDTDYYSCKNFNISDALKKNFIDGFLKSGSFTCLPVNYSDCFDYFTISNNKLYLRLHKDTLYSVPAVELSKFKVNVKNEFYDYKIDLLDLKLDVTKLHNEVKELCETQEVRFMWTPNTDDICSSSIAKYFSDTGLDVKSCRNQLINRTEYGLLFPEITVDADESRFLDVSEYIGLIMLGCRIEENDLSSYQIPSDCIDVGRGKILHCKGLITQDAIKTVINELRTIISNNLTFPWIALSTIFHSSSEKPSKLFIISKDKINIL